MTHPSRGTRTSRILGFLARLKLVSIARAWTQMKRAFLIALNLMVFISTRVSAIVRKGAGLRLATKQSSWTKLGAFLIPNKIKLSASTPRVAIFAVVTLLAPVFALSFVLFGSGAQPAEAAINDEINFQARLLTSGGGVVDDGNYNVRFRIYCGGDGDTTGAGSGADCDHAENEQLLWTEDHLNNDSNTVRIENGYLSVRLGSITSLSTVDFNEDELWLTLDIGDTNATCTPFSNCNGDGEMDPFMRFTATPYSFNSDALDGLDSTEFVQLGQNATPQAINTTNSAIAINQQGTGNLIQLQDGGTDRFVIADGGAATLTGTLSINGTTLGSNQATFNLFNSNVTTLNVGGAATTIEVGASTGTTSINNSLAIDGNLTIGSANTDTITINAGQSGTGITFADGSFDTCTALETVSGVLTCGTDDGGGTTLQTAYEAGNLIVATNAEGDIDLSVDEATNFSVDIIGTGSFLVQDGGNNILEVNDGEGLIVNGNANQVLTGSIDPDGTNTVTGVGTSFTTEIKAGDGLLVNNQTRTVTGINSDTELFVDVGFSDTANDTSPERIPAILSLYNDSGERLFSVNENQINFRYFNTSTTASVENALSGLIWDAGVVTSGSDTTRGLNINAIRTGATGGTILVTGISASATGDLAGAGTSQSYGVSANANGSDNNTAVFATARLSGSNSYATSYGLQARAGGFGGDFTGTITTTYGVEAQVTAGDGTLSTAAGLRVDSATENGSGTITNNYGLFVATQTIGDDDYGIRVDTADTQTLWISGDADNTTANAGIAFGQSLDTNLYRSAANTLRTDDRLSVGNTGALLTNDTTFDTALTFGNALSVGNGATITIDNSSAYRGILFNPTIVYEDPFTGTGGRSFEESAILKNPNGVAGDINHQTGFNAGVTVQADGAALDVDRSAFLDSTVYNTINGGTLSVLTHTSFESSVDSVGAGVTVSDLRGFNVDDSGGAGTVTTQYGLYIENLTNAGTDYGIYVTDADDYSVYLASTDGDAASGITFGGDTNLYRSAANTLFTNDSLTVNTNLTVNGNTTIGNANTDTLTINSGTSGTGITFADASFQDCILTTSAAGVLTCASTSSGASLQGAYEVGNSIIADNANGDIDLSVDEATNFSVDIIGTGSFLVQDGGNNILEVNDGEGVTINGNTSTTTLTGSIDPNGTNIVTGVGTAFTTELDIGDTILVSGEVRTVYLISSDTALLVTQPFSDNANDTSPELVPPALTINNSSGDRVFVVGDNGTHVSEISTSTTADSSVGSSILISDTGVVNSGTDINTGQIINIERTGATGGTITSSGLNISVQGDTGGTSTARGILSNAVNADTNISINANSTSIGSGALTSSTGVHAQVGGLGAFFTGSITTANGFQANLNSGSGSIGTAAGLRVAAAAGSITSNYGIIVADQTAGTSDYGIAIAGADTYALWVGSGADNTDAANGITFGLSGDTNLYRSAANTLRTDDAFVVATNLTVDTDTLYVDSSNDRVGIGTTSPSVTLEVDGSTAITGSGNIVLTGSIDPNGTTTITGVGTAFTTELEIGDAILINGETRTVISIASNTSATIGPDPFSDTGNDTSPEKIPAALLVKNASETFQFAVNESTTNIVRDSTSTQADYMNGLSVIARDIGAVSSGTDTTRAIVGTAIKTGSTGADVLVTGVAGLATGDSAGAGTSTTRGLYGRGVNGDVVYGLQAQAQLTGSGSHTSATGGELTAFADAGTTVTNLYGANVRVFDTGGTVTTAAGLRVGTATSTGTITSNYGLLVEDQTAGTSDYGIAVRGADTYALWLGSGADNTDAANGITFGLSGDVNLYRSGVNTLTTDDSFVVTGDLTIGASGSLIVTGSGTLPGSPVEGQVYWDSTNNLLLVYNGSQWEQMNGSATATYTVAASDSANASLADYRADGTADEVEIQAAIDALPAGGGTVYLMEGTFNVDDGVTLGQYDRLVGAGEGTVLFLTAARSSDINIITTDSDNFVSNMTIDGNESNQSDTNDLYGISVEGSNTNLEYLNIINNEDYGVVVESSTSGVSVTKSTFTDNDTGLFSLLTTDYLVSDNLFESNTAGGVALLYSQGVIVTDNQFSDSNVAISAATVDLSIVNNVINSPSTAGVVITDFLALDSSRVKIANNFIYNSGGATTNNAIEIQWGDDVTVEDNYIRDDSCTTTCYAINVSTANSDRTYISGNTLVTTGADDATINDSGTNTEFANQQRAGSTIYSHSTILQALGTRVLTGSIDPDGTTTVTGVGTKFLTELQVGDRITVSGETRTVSAIASNTSLTVESAFSNNANDTSPDREPASLIVMDSSGNTDLIVNGEGAKLGTTYFNTVTNSTCATDCTISQSSIDDYGTIVVEATATELEIIVPDPTILTPGRIVYITAADGSEDFTLTLNDGGSAETNISMRENVTATLIWNGADWTAAGASSSTTLQSAYDNTLTSAGGAELILNAPGGNADGLTIRNNANTPIIGALLEVQSSIGNNLFAVNNYGVEYAANGGAEVSSGFGSNWLDEGSATTSRDTTSGDYATGQASVQVITTASADDGVENDLATNLATSTDYQVSFTGQLDSGAAFTTLEVVYSPDGGSTVTASCSNYSTQTLVTTNWSKVTCDLTTTGAAVSDSRLIIRQSDASVRNFNIDNLSIRENSASSTPPNVQIGGGELGGAVTLFTLDQASSPPVASGDSTYYGSMYYDTVTGRIQCYEADGWGACGSPPNNIITITPEYAGSVLNGTGVGTMSADFCSNDAQLSVNSSLCDSGEAVNYYAWTSPQATAQTYSIYLTFQLPTTFDGFIDNNTITLDARTTNTGNSDVDYQIFRSTGSDVTECGSSTTVTTADDEWQTVSHNGDESDGCDFAAGDRVIFKLNMVAQDNDTVYVSDINFTYTND